MTPDTLRLILQAAAGVMVGGGGLAFIRYLLDRRSQLRKMDAAADVDEAAAADTLIKRLQEDGATLRQQITDLLTKVARLEDRYVTAQRDFADQLRDAHNEHTRLTTRIAQLHNDLDISGRQLEDLRRRRGSR